MYNVHRLTVQFKGIVSRDFRPLFLGLKHSTWPHMLRFREYLCDIVLACSYECQYRVFFLRKMCLKSRNSLLNIQTFFVMYSVVYAYFVQKIISQIFHTLLLNTRVKMKKNYIVNNAKFTKFQIIKTNFTSFVSAISLLHLQFHHNLFYLSEHAQSLRQVVIPILQ